MKLRVTRPGFGPKIRHIILGPGGDGVGAAHRAPSPFEVGYFCKKCGIRHTLSNTFSRRIRRFQERGYEHPLGRSGYIPGQEPAYFRLAYTAHADNERVQNGHTCLKRERSLKFPEKCQDRLYDNDGRVSVKASADPIMTRFSSSVDVMMKYTPE